MAMISINDPKYLEACKTNQLVVMQFSAEWCRPCKNLLPIMKHYSSIYDGQVLFVYIDIDENRDQSDWYEIEKLPTVLFFKNNQELDRMIAPKSEQIYQKLLELAGYPNDKTVDPTTGFKKVELIPDNF